jgi:AcrR family transcriptional regulator
MVTLNVYVGNMAELSDTENTMKSLKKDAGQYHHGQLKDALVLAAEQQIARTGEIALPLREVAKRAGVSHAAAYRHFASKTELLAELATRGFMTLTERLRSARDLSEAAVAYVALASERPGTFRVMFHGSLKPFTAYPVLVTAAGHALDELKRVVAVEVARGALRDDQGNTAVSTVWATVHGLAMLLIDGQLEGPFPGQFDDVTAAARRAMATLLKPSASSRLRS